MTVINNANEIFPKIQAFLLNSEDAIKNRDLKTSKH